MKISEVIKNIESDYETKKIKHNNLILWLDFRNRFFYSLSIGKESNLIIDSKLYFTVLKSLFYGFFNWFKSYDCWVFSASIYRNKINGKYYDKFFDYPASKFKRSLFIELATKPHYKREQVFSEYIVSKSPIIIFEKLVAIFISIKKIDLNILNEIQEEYKTSIDPSYSIKKMISQYKVMKLLLFFKKHPKVVFVAPSYMNFSYVKALKEKNVKVIEVQHGVINKEHFGYNYFDEFDGNYFPDYLLSYGEKEKEVFSGGNTFIDGSKVISVGSYYIDYLINNFKSTINVSNYELTFSVSMQDCEIGSRVLPFLINIARNNKDYLFLMKTRRTPIDEYMAKYSIPDNITFVEVPNVYEVILHSDYHITAYSSCALEAPALGVKNLLINFDNKAKEYFEEVLDENTTAYVGSEQDFVESVKSEKILPKSEIKTHHKRVVNSNYQHNIDEFFRHAQIIN